MRTSFFFLLGFAFFAAACAPTPGERPDVGPTDVGFINLDSGTSRPDGGGPSDVTTTPGSGGLLIRGRAVITMTAQGVIAPGEVHSVDGRIACVGAPGSCDAADATVVESTGIVLPGLVDAHNHVAFNWLPEWEPGRLWEDHTQWQQSSEYDVFIDPQSSNKGTTERFCAMLQWGELRSLVNGTTTVFGVPQARTCIRWLVRNAELSSNYSGWDADRMRSNTLGINTVDANDASNLIGLMTAGDVTAYVIHLAEGISTRAHNEFDDLVMLGLLRPETVIIHGTALTPTDMTQVAIAGSKLVWSPSSNMVLYGDTTDVNSAVAEGVSVSLAPDWTPSGEDDLLHEARFAKDFVANRWPGLFNDQQLVEMITRIPAEQLSVDADVGALEVGRYADILVLDVPAGSDPYADVLTARPQNVQLVTIAGVPSYGDPALLAQIPTTPASCVSFDACGTSRSGCWEDPPSGPTTPDGMSSIIESFFPAGPLSLFDCD